MPAPGIPRVAPATIVSSCSALRADVADVADILNAEHPFGAFSVPEVILTLCQILDQLTVMVGALARVVQEP